MAIDPVLDRGGLFRLMAWLSPAFPVGAFAYSHGIECAVEQGLVRDRVSLTHWVVTIVGHGTGAVDAVLFREAWAAAAADDAGALDRIAELGAAFRGSGETALESAVQGSAFLETVAEAWPGSSGSSATAASAARWIWARSARLASPSGSSRSSTSQKPTITDRWFLNS